jgi:hypothetical protein
MDEMKLKALTKEAMNSQVALYKATEAWKEADKRLSRFPEPKSQETIFSDLQTALDPDSNETGLDVELTLKEWAKKTADHLDAEDIANKASDEMKKCMATAVEAADRLVKFMREGK